MTLLDKVEAVQRMQDYIEEHLDEPASLTQLAKIAGYTPAHASRAFKELAGLPPLEYLRARRLSRAAQQLRDTPGRILDIALEAMFDSHEGFTRAFSRQFGLTPVDYRRKAPPIPLFLPRSAKASYLHYVKGANQMMGENLTNIVCVQMIERPARKLILQRGKTAADYFEYCEEVGCDVWGVLCSIKDALYEPIGMWLSEHLRTPGTSEYAQGVEVPVDYSGPVPAGMELIDLPPCKMMVFHGQPFLSEEAMEQAIQTVWKAMENYQPEVYGFKWADEDGPRFQLAPLLERGYIEARPVRAIE